MNISSKHIRFSFTTTLISILFLSTTHTLILSNSNQTHQNTSYNNSPITYLFSHGYGGTGQEAYYYSTHENSIVGAPHTIKTFNYPDCKYFDTHSLRPTDLGQTNDVATLAKAYDEIIATNPSARIVVYGPSRGASTIVNFLAQHKAENIIGVILESPFDHGKSVARQRAKESWLYYLPFSTQIAHNRMATLLVHYKTNGLQPINSVTHIRNKQLPILIICSRQDTVIPRTSSICLYNKFKAEGFENCHVLTLDRGMHANLLWGPDGHLYHEAVHNFYKQHNIISV